MNKTHVLSGNSKTYRFSGVDLPVSEVPPGSIVRFETSDDSYERLSQGEPLADVWKQANPVTGPVAIRGAVKGDALRIEILAIDIRRAWVVWLADFGPLGHAGGLNEVKEVSIQDGKLEIGTDSSINLDPMIGCIGVAPPKKGIGSTVGPAGRWGGNMDIRDLRPGSTLYLPVFHPGGLLSLGDLHAAMGAGEPCCVAIEAIGSATVRLDVVPGANIQYPRIDVPGGTLCVGVGQCIKDAQGAAIREAWKVLGEKTSLSDAEAFAFASARLELRSGTPGAPLALAFIPSVHWP
jgi:amidase